MIGETIRFRSFPIALTAILSWSIPSPMCGERRRKCLFIAKDASRCAGKSKVAGDITQYQWLND